MVFSKYCKILRNLFYTSIQDANAPYGVKQDEDGNYVSDLRPPPSREAAMLINTVLIIVSFLDIIFSLPSVIITLRELCNCYDPSLLRHGPSKQDWRLMSWLGQHQPGLASPVWYSPASASVPYNKMPANVSLLKGMTEFRVGEVFLICRKIILIHGQGPGFCYFEDNRFK